MVRTAVQLYTLRDLHAPPWEVVSRVGDTSFDGVELYDTHFDLFDDDETLRRTAEALGDADLDVAAAHAGIDRLESATGDVVEICDALDCPRVVVPSYDSEAFTTKEGIDGAADRIATLAADVTEYDLEVLYHNHSFEFGDIGDEVAFEAFVDRADGRFGYEPDVGLARRAEYDPLELLDLVGDRAPVVHLTDTVPGDANQLHADLGDGVVDTESCAVTAAENGAEWIVCENGTTDDGAGSLEHGSVAFDELRRRANEGSAAR